MMFNQSVCSLSYLPKACLCHIWICALLPPVLGAAPLELEFIFEDDEFDECKSRLAAEGVGLYMLLKSGMKSRVIVTVHQP